MDGIFVFGNNLAKIGALFEHLSSHFEIKNLG